MNIFSLNKNKRRSEVKTYSFVGRHGRGLAWFECRQTGIISLRKVKILNSSKKSLEFYV
jgi:hypothetical protein